MTVDRKTPYTSSHDGRTVYFCSAHCKNRFDPTEHAANA